MKLQAKRLTQLAYWISEREAIRVKRAAGLPTPWTEDKILQSTRFCNVRRMDDKVSRWLLENWYPAKINSQLSSVDANTMLAAAGLARLINWPETLEVLRNSRAAFFEWNFKDATARLEERKAAGEKIFTGAYIINAASGGSKTEIVLRQVNTMYRHPELLDSSNMAATHTLLQKIPGIGSFIAGQIVADLRHVWPGKWADRHTWAPLGPGSHRGMGWLQGWDGIAKLSRIKQDDFEQFLGALVSELKTFDSFKTVFVDRGLEMHDIQNCLCEFDKFMRLTMGTGQAKNKFNGYQGRLDM